MLSLGCRLYLRNARPGTTSRHRARCSSCNEYLSLIERSAVSDPALPPELGRRLRSISARGALVPMEKETPLPARLAGSLQTIFPPRPRLVPAFIGSPFYAVAASYVLVLAIGLVWGNPYDLFAPTLSNMTASASAAAAAATEALDRSGGVVSGWLGAVRSEVSETEQSARRLGRKMAEGLGAVLEPISAQGDNDGTRQP